VLIVVLKSIRNFRVWYVIVIILIIFLINAAAIAMPNITYSQSFPSVSYSSSTYTTNNNKVVILTFDDGYKSQYTNAKPILDKYGFKATFYITCNHVGNGEELVHPNARIGWENITALYNEGHDIGSHL